MKKVIVFTVVYAVISVVVAFELGVSITMDICKLLAETAAQELSTEQKVRATKFSFYHLVCMSVANFVVALLFGVFVLRKGKASSQQAPVARPEADPNHPQ